MAALENMGGAERGACRRLAFPAPLPLRTVEGAAHGLEAAQDGGRDEREAIGAGVASHRASPSSSSVGGPSGLQHGEGGEAQLCVVDGILKEDRDENEEGHGDHDCATVGGWVGGWHAQL